MLGSKFLMKKFLCATETAYFPKGMKVSELEDTICLELPLQPPPPRETVLWRPSPPPPRRAR